MEALDLVAQYRQKLASALPRLREQIATATASTGRDAASVRLVAVSKGHPLEALQAALDMGLNDLGENRVEELESKVAALQGSDVRWHMIGHIQSRKAARVVAVGGLIHSVDSLRLAEKISRIGTDRGCETRVLAQINTSGEQSKSGFDGPAAVDALLAMAELPNLRVEGLMTMAPYVDDEAVLSAAFARLRATMEEARRQNPAVGAELSMGMTNDLEIAIREGSTMIRIGTALFGERVR